jgi:hypothetical protein
MADETTEPEATTKRPGRRRPSQLVIALLGIGVSVVLAGGSFGAWWAIANRPAPAAASSQSTPSASAETAAETSTATPTPAPELSRVDFRSESGNLRCAIATLDGQYAAVCQQVNTNYAAPTAACAGGAPGVFVGVSVTGVFWPCMSGSIESANPLAYDTPVSHGGFTCSISYATGVRCQNPDGQGFTMEYDAGVQTF